MYEPKSTYQKVISTFKLLPNKTNKEIQRALDIYGLETFNKEGELI